LILNVKTLKMKTQKHKSYISNLLFLSLLWIAQGCSIEAHVQKDPEAEFDNYKTFNWLVKDDSVAQKYTDFQDKNIKASISKELHAKGFEEFSNGDADVSIDYDVMVESDVRNESEPVYSRSYVRYLYNPYTRTISSIWYPSQYLGQNTYSVPYKSGTITINLVDNKTNSVVWQGWAETEVDRKNLSSDEIETIVEAIFKKFKR
jgi:hypothetical protein